MKTILIAGAACLAFAALIPFTPTLSTGGIATCLIVILSTILDEKAFFTSQPEADSEPEFQPPLAQLPPDIDEIKFPPPPALPSASQESSAAPAHSR